MDHHDEAFLQRAAAARARITETPADSVDGLAAAGTRVIDVREAAEHATNQVAGALNLPLDTLAERVAAAIPDKSTPIITYCNGGNRGALGADTLVNLGYTNVKSIAGGLRAYLALQARTVAPAGVKPEAQFLLDVRREADYAASGVTLPDAVWKNPDQIDAWAASIPRDREVVLYCVRGGAVSNTVVDTLRAAGVNARYIEGGIEAYQAAGGALAHK